jgi:hypothetical protein
LIPHIPQTLCETYWKAKEHEKGILVKKSLLSSSSTYTKNTSSPPTYPLSKPQIPFQPCLPPKQSPQTNINPQPPNKQIPIKSRELGKCWGCNEPWTPEHKFSCKFRKVVNAMALEPEQWLEVEQQMEELNHTLLQPEKGTDPMTTTREGTDEAGSKGTEADANR